MASRAIENGQIFDSEAWHEITVRAAKGGTVHFIGLLSDGNVPFIGLKMVFVTVRG